MSTPAKASSSSDEGVHFRPSKVSKELQISDGLGFKTKISNHGELNCDQCPRVCNDNDELRRHTRSHLVVMPFPCGACEKKFNLEDNMIRHVVSRHRGNPTFIDSEAYLAGIKLHHPKFLTSERLLKFIIGPLKKPIYVHESIMRQDSADFDSVFNKYTLPLKPGQLIPEIVLRNVDATLFEYLRLFIYGRGLECPGPHEQDQTYGYGCKYGMSWLCLCVLAEEFLMEDLIEGCESRYVECKRQSKTLPSLEEIAYLEAKECTARDAAWDILLETFLDENHPGNVTLHEIYAGLGKDLVGEFEQRVEEHWELEREGCEFEECLMHYHHREKKVERAEGHRRSEREVGEFEEVLMPYPHYEEKVESDSSTCDLFKVD